MPNIIGADSAGNYEITSSVTDTTAGRVTKVGDFGIGETNQIEYPVNNIDTHTVPTGMYRTVSSNTGTFPSGFNQFGTMLVERYSADEIKQTYFDIVSNRIAVREINVGVVGAWREFYTTANLNTNEFGGNATFDIIADGVAYSATNAIFSLPISSLTAPTSITVTGTFEVSLFGNASLGSGFTVGLSGASSNKLAIVEVSGLSGLTIGQPLSLISDSISSKITVNF